MALEGRTTELQDNPRFFYHNSSISTGILSRQQQIVNVHIHDIHAYAYTSSSSPLTIHI
jgi:hypothetical protein